MRRRPQQQPHGVWVRMGLIASAAMALSAPASSTAPYSDVPSVLQGTIAEESHLGFSRRIEAGAIGLWAIGSIEAHGPHLPLATDVYVPSAQIVHIKARLASQGVSSFTLPPYYWAVNQVTGSFPGSLDIAPRHMTGVLCDVLKSLHRSGVRRVYLITGHYDAAHNSAIAEAVAKARDFGLVATFLAPDRVAKRAGLTGLPGVLPVDLTTGPALPFADLHGGRRETSMMLHAAPAAVDRERLAALAPTVLDADRVVRWREGYDSARRLTPDGYLGAPAEATASEGRRDLIGEADIYADAILTDLAAARDRGALPSN